MSQDDNLASKTPHGEPPTTDDDTAIALHDIALEDKPKKEEEKKVEEEKEVEKGMSGEITQDQIPTSVVEETQFTENGDDQGANGQQPLKATNNRLIPAVDRPFIVPQHDPDEPPPERKLSKTNTLMESSKKVAQLLTTSERFLFFVGLFSAILLGLVPPYVIYAFGNLVEAFVIHARSQSNATFAETFSNDTISKFGLDNTTESAFDNTTSILTSVTLENNSSEIYANLTSDDVFVTNTVPSEVTSDDSVVYENITTAIYFNKTSIEDVNNNTIPIDSEAPKLSTVPSIFQVNATDVLEDSRERRDAEDDDDNETFGEVIEDVLEEDHLLTKTSSFGLGMAILALTSFIVGFFMVLTLSLATENFMYRMRKMILQSILHHHIYWFEQHGHKDLEEFMSQGLKKFQNILGENLGLLICFFTSVVACLMEALMYGWKLAFVLFTLLPCYAGGSWLYSKLDKNHTERQKEEYLKAEATARSSLVAIRPIIAYGGENKEIARFCDSVQGIRETGERRGWVTSLILSLVAFVKHSAFSVAFWYGISLAVRLAKSDHPEYRTKELYIVLFSSFYAASTFAQLIPFLEAIYQALPVIQKSFDLMQVSSLIDSSSPEGLKPRNCKGSIEFSNIHFSYPSNIYTTVLSGLSFAIEVGETVALVGPAKGGKSTILQLIQRFYDPENGKVSVDDHDVRELNVGWLRSQIGVVEAEPVLFSTTIRENIRYGRQNASFEAIEHAARAANAHDFIIRLPQQYDTIIGEHGTALSDSKKQRLAIARALIRDPKILLLDGATSHMDIKSDRVVQEALENAIASRTTIIVPHEISSIIQVHRILVIAEGTVVESGDHQSLMELKGVYYDLYTEELKNKKPEFPDWKGVNEQEDELQIPSTAAERSDSDISPTTASPIQRKRLLIQKDWFNIEKFQGRQTFTRLFRSGRNYAFFSSLGVFSAIVNGLLFVVFTVIIGHYHGLLSNRNHQDVVLAAHHYAMVVFVVGIFAALFCFLQHSMFVYYGERLSNMLRKQMFAAILHQELIWFEDPANDIKNLCANLNLDPISVRDMAGYSMAPLIQTGVMSVAAVLIMIIYSWKIAIISVMFMAIGVFISCLQAKVLAADSALHMSSMDAAAKIANEGIRNIKTLASLHAQNIVCTQYQAALHRIQKLSLDIYSIRGMLFGITRCAPLLLFSAVNSLGGYLIMVDVLEHSKVIVIQLLTEATFQGLTQAVSFAFNARKGLEAAHRIFRVLDHRPRIDSSINSGFMLPVRGSRSIQFESISFNYNPSRGSTRALTDVTFEMVEKELTAIVGPKGAGKSACAYLIGRFYDPKIGAVVVDHIDIQNLNVPWLRSQVAFVSEDFLLRDRTIAENVLCGNNVITVRMVDVIDACRTVGIHDFIQTLRKGYETLVEDERIQESRLRKLQIIAARAVIRKPRIILLDHVVPPPGSEDLQDILDLVTTLREGRTCVMTSRYVTSLPNPDHIVVLQKTVVEQGTHEQLLQKRGNYYRQWHRERVVLHELVERDVVSVDRTEKEKQA